MTAAIRLLRNLGLPGLAIGFGIALGLIGGAAVVGWVLGR